MLTLEKEASRLAAPALVVAPTSLAFNWSREIERFAPHLVAVLTGLSARALLERLGEFDVVVSTYPVLIRDVERLEKIPFSTIVLDGRKPSRTRAARRTGGHKGPPVAEHRICLSGTRSRTISASSGPSSRSPSPISSEASRSSAIDSASPSD